MWPEDIADNIDAAVWCVTVEARGHGLWGVYRGTGSGAPCWGEHGWGYEPLPSSRTDEWRATHRYTLERALEIARELAPKVTLNGLTALEAVARLRGAS